jgi:hypothetical protein
MKCVYPVKKMKMKKVEMMGIKFVSAKEYGFSMKKKKYMIAPIK